MKYKALCLIVGCFAIRLIIQFTSITIDFLKEGL